jgi:hypothetical protein
MPYEDVRISFLWVRSLLDLLAVPAPRSTFTFLPDIDAYAAAIDASIAGHSVTPDLGPPWDDATGARERTRFWAKLISGNGDAAISGKKAARHAVPLGRPLAVSFATSNPDDHLSAVAYVFPFAIGLAVQARVNALGTLGDVVTRAQAIRTDPIDVARLGQPGTRQTLEAFAAATLDDLAHEVTPEPAAVDLRVDPFTVVTVVDAPGEAIPIDVPPDAAIQGELFALTAWRDRRAGVKAPPLEAASLPIMNHAPSDVLYAQPRGRAIWYPVYFLGALGPTTALSYRHRCLTSLSLQVEALAGFLVATDELMATRELTSAHQDWARLVGRVVGRLYGQLGLLSTFRSPSVARHIDDNGYAASIDTIRRVIGSDPPLHR